MNRVYKVVWSRTKQAYVVASEFAKSCSGKSAVGRKKSAIAAALAVAAIAGTPGGV